MKLMDVIHYRYGIFGIVKELHGNCDSFIETPKRNPLHNGLWGEKSLVVYFNDVTPF